MFYLFGELGVNLFFLITGYFMVDGKFSRKKAINMLLEVEFYNLIIIFIANKFGVYTFTETKQYFLMFFPVILDRFWFVTVYIILYLLSPYLNILIDNMTKYQHKKLLIILILIWSIIPTFFGIFYNTTESLLYYSRFIWAIVIYFVGAYIKRYNIKFLEKTANCLICALSSFFIMIITIPIIYHFKNLFLKLGTTEPAYFWPPNTILMFILSISIFCIFLKINIGENRIINKLSSTTLAVYMLHDGYLIPLLWNNIFHNAIHLQSKFSIFYILLSAILIFIVFSLFDLSRQFFVKIINKKIRNLR